MEFEFLKPNAMIDDDLELVLVKTIPASENKRGQVPAYQFDMRHTDTKEKIGDISLRIGYNENIKYGGNIGYTVEEKFRGNHYAARSIKLLLPFAKQNGLKELTTTCNPDNAASRRTSELAGGKLIEIVDLPEENDQYKRGDRQKCIYKFDL
jgi:predicted acetyltransferase